jgi:hypothetical protein
VSPVLLAVIALVTYASRAAALIFLPRPRGRFEALLGRMPAPMFASLATLTLLTGERWLVEGPVLSAALGALLLSPRRSLPLCLAGGVAGYVLGGLIL